MASRMMTPRRQDQPEYGIEPMAFWGVFNNVAKGYVDAENARLRSEGKTVMADARKYDILGELLLSLLSGKTDVLTFKIEQGYRESLPVEYRLVRDAVAELNKKFGVDPPLMAYDNARAERTDGKTMAGSQEFDIAIKVFLNKRNEDKEKNRKEIEGIIAKFNKACGPKRLRFSSATEAGENAFDDGGALEGVWLEGIRQFPPKKR